MLHFEAMQARIEAQQNEIAEMGSKYDSLQVDRLSEQETKDREIAKLRDALRELEHDMLKLREEV